MNFQVFHVNPGKKLKKKDVNNNFSHFMLVFPITRRLRYKTYNCSYIVAGCPDSGPG